MLGAPVALFATPLFDVSFSYYMRVSGLSVYSPEDQPLPPFMEFLATSAVSIAHAVMTQPQFWIALLFFMAVMLLFGWANYCLWISVKNFSLRFWLGVLLAPAVPVLALSVYQLMRWGHLEELQNFAPFVCAAALAALLVLIAVEVTARRIPD